MHPGATNITVMHSKYPNIEPRKLHSNEVFCCIRFTMKPNGSLKSEKKEMISNTML